MGKRGSYFPLNYGELSVTLKRKFILAIYQYTFRYSENYDYKSISSNQL